jgi:hypothetical protein
MIVMLLFDAGFSRTSGLTFWSDPYGRDRGFWTGANGAPTPINELWLDVQVAREDTAKVQRANPSPLEQANWASAAANGLPRLCEVERVALWGICA